MEGVSFDEEPCVEIEVERIHDSSSVLERTHFHIPFNHGYHWRIHPRPTYHLAWVFGLALFIAGRSPYPGEWFSVWVVDNGYN